MPEGSHSEIRNGELIAAVDMGSNSFHMVVARYEHGQLRVIDRLRDSVRLAAGLKADGSLEAERLQRALDCLARFGQRLSALPEHRVRAVATNSVRRLRFPQEFLDPAETALGHAIEIVSGREEARLIYLGVAHALPDAPGRRLVIDIGGGSTEFIIGQGFDALEKESLQMGCVASTLRFFADGKLTPKRWRQAQTEITVELQQFSTDYRSHGWSETIGSSGTIKAISNIVQAAGWCDSGISRSALQRLVDTMLSAGSLDNLRLSGLSDERRGVIAGGVSILEASFNALGLQHMQVCDTAMREGLLYDMIGRSQHRDPRTISISALALRYATDKAQAERIEKTALALYEEVAGKWQFTHAEHDWLVWSARIHEIGLAIAHSQYHVHGAYIVENSDLPGFSRQEQQVLAAVVRSHRRKPDPAIFQALPERLRISGMRITALIRLAVLLNRSRAADALPPLELGVDDKQLTLKLPHDWLEQHPLSRADLEQERDYLKHLDIKLQVRAKERDTA